MLVWRPVILLHFAFRKRKKNIYDFFYKFFLKDNAGNEEIITIWALDASQSLFYVCFANHRTIDTKRDVVNGVLGNFSLGTSKKYLFENSMAKNSCLKAMQRKKRVETKARFFSSRPFSFLVKISAWSEWSVRAQMKWAKILHGWAHGRKGIIVLLSKDKSAMPLWERRSRKNHGPSSHSTWHFPLCAVWFELRN